MSSFALNTYPEYKNSGVLGVGSIPIDWEELRIKFVVRERVEKGYPNEPLLAATQSRGVVKKTEYENRTVTATKDLHLLKLVKVDDFVISLRSFQGGIEISHTQGIISPAYTILAPGTRVGPTYLKYYFKSAPFVSSLGVFVTGIREGQNIEYARLSRATLPAPPPEDQGAIVRYLDWASGRLDRVIRAKRKIIALLNEQKQAKIHNAIAGDYCRATQMESNLPWIDAVPGHWQWVPIKRLLNRIDYGTSEATKEDARIPVLSMANIQQGEVSIPHGSGLDSVPDSMLLEHNDLLFTRTNGNPDLVGKVGIFRGQKADKVTFASYLVRLRANPDNDPEWLHFLLNSVQFWQFARSHALVNLQTNLNSTRYGQFLVPMPPYAEQLQMVTRLKQSLGTC